MVPLILRVLDRDSTGWGPLTILTVVKGLIT